MERMLEQVDRARGQEGSEAKKRKRSEHDPHGSAWHWVPGQAREVVALGADERSSDTSLWRGVGTSTEGAGAEAPARDESAGDNGELAVAGDMDTNPRRDSVADPRVSGDAPSAVHGMNPLAGVAAASAVAQLRDAGAALATRATSMPHPGALVRGTAPAEVVPVQPVNDVDLSVVFRSWGADHSLSAQWMAASAAWLLQPHTDRMRRALLAHARFDGPEHVTVTATSAGARGGRKQGRSGSFSQ
ncbi:MULTISPECIES: hypothetical protein [Dyella]|uniref:hypothetical protein n=1 Tax=Dyella TaxID=231454 RepID=UPI0013F1557C|nr:MULTISPECIES: hypothetical protein [Dyella]